MTRGVSLAYTLSEAGKRVPTRGDASQKTLRDPARFLGHMMYWCYYYFVRSHKKVPTRGVSLAYTLQTAASPSSSSRVVTGRLSAGEYCPPSGGYSTACLTYSRIDKVCH